jgi:benzoyl-CoA reductase/2-hydroxyglutaryl-CoA dehydratase subunit BcrC/BadD/HgdB
MRETKELLKICQDISDHPRAQLDALLAEGKKVVGCLPYFCPEELVYAAGMVPFGLWGAQTQVSEAKRYYPAFICSLLQTTLELGIRGAYRGLSAVMIPITCDSLKGMGTNWEYGVKDIPVINVAYAQNRKLPAGVEFTASQFRKIAGQLAELSGHQPTAEDIAAAVARTNRDRAALRSFSALAAAHPELVSPAQRSAVLKCGYFMEIQAHTALVEELNQALSAAPAQAWKGLKIVTTGIMADMPDLLDIFQKNQMAVVADQVIHESGSFKIDIPVTDDPIVGLAQQLANLEGCSVLYDPEKNRAKELVKLAQDTGADGVIFVLTKFCDPEEYDYVPVKQMLAQAGIPLLQVEVDQQMTNYEQARSAIETFADVLR